jgi:uracil-DNA glycosylase
LRRCASQSAGAIRLFSSYHCSRYNTNTGRLTAEMFVGVFEEVAEFLARRQVETQ